MNLAALWRLPVLFVCENNLYAMGTAVERAEAETDISRKAAAYRVPSEAVDGMDPVAVEAAARGPARSCAAARPCLPGVPHLPLPGAFDVRRPALPQQGGDRAPGARAIPIRRLQGWLEENGLIDQDDLARIEAEVRAEVEAALAFAEAGTLEPVEDSRASSPWTRCRRDRAAAAASDSPIARPAGRRSARRSWRDPRVFLMGEDVGRYGGCYAVTKGLIEEFGEDRIRDTPLSESAFTGAGIGAAMVGMRPIVEVMTCNFSLLALDQILNNAATIPHMSGGQFAVPLGDPHGDRRRAPARRPALAQPGGLVRPHPGDQGAGTRPPSRTPASCWRGTRRSQPGADLRAHHALQHGGRARPGRHGGRHRSGQGRREGRTSRSSPTAGACSRRWTPRPSWRPKASRPR